MGGFGSGGRLSDEEKRRRGTFRSDKSDERYDEIEASKVVAGPWLSEIPEPTFKLSDIGKKKYNELAQALFEQNKLTIVTVMQAEVAARLFDKIYTLSLEDKFPSASDTTQYQRAINALRIAENAKTIAKPGNKGNRFAGSGFSNRRNATFRLRKAGSADSGDR